MTGSAYRWSLIYKRHHKNSVRYFESSMSKRISWYSCMLCVLSNISRCCWGMLERSRQPILLREDPLARKWQYSYWTQQVFEPCSRVLKSSWECSYWANFYRALDGMQASIFTKIASILKWLKRECKVALEQYRKLIKALRIIQLNDIASNIEQLLLQVSILLIYLDMIIISVVVIVGGAQCSICWLTHHHYSTGLYGNFHHGISMTKYPVYQYYHGIKNTDHLQWS